MNLQDGVSLSEGLIVTIFSMGVVFLTLISISLILEMFKLIFYKKSAQKLSVKKGRSPIGDNMATDVRSEIIGEEIIAVISAAIVAHTSPSFKRLGDENLAAVISAAILSNNGSNIDNLNIKSIKRI